MATISATFFNDTDQKQGWTIFDLGVTPSVTLFTDYLDPGADTGPLTFDSSDGVSGKAGYSGIPAYGPTVVNLTDGDRVAMR